MNVTTVPENEVNNHSYPSNFTKDGNVLFDHNHQLTCYDKKDLESIIEFLFKLSSSMQHIVIGLSITGVIMNLSGVYILSTRKSMKNTFNQLMVSLYCIDSLFLVAYAYLSLTLSYIKVQHPAVAIISRFIKLFYSFAFNCSIFLTVAISHERYIAMQYPLIHSAIMSTGQNRRLRLLKYILLITIFALILIVPEYLEFEFIWTLDHASVPTNNFTNRR